MSQKSIPVQIILWIEVVVAIRTLLFSLPVLINDVFQKSMSYTYLGDKFVLVLSILAVVYLVVGIASLLGSRIWRQLHFLAASIVIVITLVWNMNLQNNSAEMHVFYFFPLGFSLLSLCGMEGFRCKTNCAI